MRIFDTDSWMRDVVIALAAVLCIVGLFSLHHRIVPSVLQPFDAASARTQWIDAIQREGATQAYRDFLVTYQGTDSGTQHSAAHLIGKLLYEAEGPSGISVCDPSFAFGCYHGFFIAAIAAQGIAIVPTLDAACATVESHPSGCRHGIGHGIMEYLGPTELLKALDICKTKTTTNVIGGCYSGVFMEYNAPLSISTAGAFVTAMRAFDAMHPYDPCPSVPAASQQSCYHELPQWWELALHQDYVRLAALCAAAPVPARSACVRGVGNAYFASHNRDAVAAVRFCENLFRDASAPCSADFSPTIHP